VLGLVAARPALAQSTPVMKVGTNFWDLGWGIWDDVFVSGASFADPTASPWRPLFLQEIQPYAALRFMDFGGTNDSTVRQWSDRTPPDAPAADQVRLAYEWMIDLCNRTHQDMWVTIPHLADDDFVFRLAMLIRATLDRSLKVYVEWSNETWNGQFEQTRHAYEQGLALGLDPDPWTAAFKYHVYAAVRVFAQFEKSFGPHSRRLVKVLAGQSGNPWVTSVHLAALADPRINPARVTANAYAIAPYFGRDVDGYAAGAVNLLRLDMRATLGEVIQQHAVVSPSGLKLLAYEGGQHVLQGANLINARPEMLTIYKEYLDGLAPYLSLFMHYVHSGQWSPGGAWGAVQRVGAPSAKLRALFSWIASH
jgi:hypothetical protein